MSENEGSSNGLGKGNGVYCCSITPESLDMIEESHQNSRALLKYAKHLENLNALPEIKNTLLNAAIGRKHVDIETFNKITVIFGGVIAALLFVIVFLLTGEKFGWVNLFK